MLKTCVRCKNQLEAESNFHQRIVRGRNIWQATCKTCLQKRRGICCGCATEKRLGAGGKCANCRFREEIATDPERLRVFQRSARERHLKKKYGITLLDYEKILIAQGGKCAICAAADNGKTKNGESSLPFMVDHNHVTGENRGLLCTACNFLIGLLEANSLRYEAAKIYLDKFAAQSIGIGV